MSTPPLFAVILAGGSGTRFWPASTRELPKQFLKLAGKRTLLAETHARIASLIPLERTLVVTAAAYAGLVQKTLKRLPPGNILAEPCARNTAAAVAWAALEIEAREPGAAHVVLPSDHVIHPAPRLRDALRAACDEACASGALVTFGVRPSYPATGYGYIEIGSALGEHQKLAIHAVQRFVEKPDRARAESFLASGRFLWNSGMFAWTTSSILSALREFAPAVHGPLSLARASERASLYPGLPSISVDHAILEKARNVRVVPVDFTWSDVGSWSAIPEVTTPDAHGNSASGGTTVITEDARGCVVYGKLGELTALIGVENMVVVRAGKCVLVCPKDRAQDVKKIVTRLENEGPSFL
jgi:mannose-1-phosphate guanylyltransferase